MSDQARFKEQLKRQLGFIERSCAAYDEGYIDEAVRIATTIRVLLHDTKSSTSLLSHLGAKDVLLITTSKTDSPGPKVTCYEGLLKFSMKGLKPKLGYPWKGAPIPADRWWDQTILVDKGQRFTRKDIVLLAANKDGGAHVDKNLTPEYQALTEGLWIEFTPGVAATPVKDHQFMIIRQMGYEIMFSEDLRALSVV